MAAITATGLGTVEAASASSGPPASVPPQAIMSPSSGVGNEQVVTVNWAGLPRTKPDPRSLFPDDEVGIYECTATTPDGTWYYSRDCFTQLPPNAYPAPADGNMLDPTLTQNFHGVTTASGTGQNGFQVLIGTLHTNSRFGRPAFNIQCDASHPCVLKVVDFGRYFRDGFTVPNPVGFNQTGDWSDLVDHAPSVPISFATAALCPPPAATTPQVRVQGAPSASYAVEAWSARLCTGSSPEVVDYAQLGEDLARLNLQTGATDIALGAVSPKSGPSGGYVAAPADVSGVAIAFNMIDAKTGVPITTLRLTPRLVAMLVTDSAIYGAAAYPAADYYALTKDPEFVALNPGYNFPADPNSDPNNPTLGVIEPILEGYQGDDTAILTRWIAGDADARAFLSGHDLCGQRLNPNWTGVTYPTSIFNDLEQNTPTLPLSGYYNPITNLATEVADIFYAKAAGYQPPSLGAPNPMPPLNTQVNALFGAFDATSAARSGEPAASLLPASAASTIGNYVDVSTGKCTPKTLSQFPGFVSPTPGGLSLGLGAMTVNADGTLAPPVSTTTAGAYPLTKVDYIFAPDHGLSSPSATAIADFIRFAGGEGQAPGVLPYGYTPLPSYLQAEDAAAAAAVLKGVPAPVPPGGHGHAPSPGSSPPSSSSGTGGVPAGTGSGTSSTTTGAAGAASPANATGRPGAGSAGALTAGSSSRTASPALVPIQAVQAPFSILGMDRTATWLFVLFIVITGVLAVVGAGLYWGVTPRKLLPRRRPPGSAA